MANLARHGTPDHVGEPAVAMRGHGDQVAFLALGGRRDLVRGFTRREYGFDVQSVPPEAGRDLLEVAPVVAHLLRLAQLQRFDVPRHPSVRHVDQDQPGLARPRQRAHVREDRLVGVGMLERNEDALVHQASHSLKVWTRSQTLSDAITTATTYASHRSQEGLLNSPIFLRSDVNWTRGTTAKDSCSDRITWLRIRSFAVPLAPKKIAVSAAGTMATARVISRRSQGRSRILRNPSITIWPASVPVSVEFCPEARSARAKTALAPPTPSSGVSSSCACWISATWVLPLRWNVAAATIRIAALMNSANDRAMVESRNAQRIAVRFPDGVSS